MFNFNNHTFSEFVMVLFHLVCSYFIPVCFASPFLTLYGCYFFPYHLEGNRHIYLKWFHSIGSKLISQTFVSSGFLALTLLLYFGILLCILILSSISSLSLSLPPSSSISPCLVVFGCLHPAPCTLSRTRSVPESPRLAMELEVLPTQQPRQGVCWLPACVFSIQPLGTPLSREQCTGLYLPESF